MESGIRISADWKYFLITGLCYIEQYELFAEKSRWGRYTFKTCPIVFFGQRREQDRMSFYTPGKKWSNR